MPGMRKHYCDDLDLSLFIVTCSPFTQLLLAHAAVHRWLQYHPKDTGGLPGMLPLAIGMRVALTEHLDRSKDKMLLKGRVGRIHSWVWEDGDDWQPSVVYVKFDGATWQLDGIDEPGVYPRHPLKRTWHLDGRRSNPFLNILRQQLPLTPAYAMTVHSSQGKTLAAVLLDLDVDKRVDTTFGAVAQSRVRSRYDCLFLRPFPLWLFQRGVSDGPHLLLQSLRGEEVDWDAYREGRAPVAKCSTCQNAKTLDCFEHEQWDRVRANLPAMCMECRHGQKGPRMRKLDKGVETYTFSACKLKKIEDAFPRAQLKQEDAKKCLACCKAVTQLQCCECRTAKTVSDFHPSMVTLPADGAPCKSCQAEVEKQAFKKFRKNWFTCRGPGCQQVLPTAEASG